MRPFLNYGFLNKRGITTKWYHLLLTTVEDNGRMNFDLTSPNKELYFILSGTCRYHAHHDAVIIDDKRSKYGFVLFINNQFWVDQSILTPASILKESFLTLSDQYDMKLAIEEYLCKISGEIKPDNLSTVDAFVKYITH